MCEGCPYYDPVDSRIVIIKLGAAGDVLRTTALLPSVKDLYPRSHITWVCGSKSIALIRNNPMIDRPLVLSDESVVILDQDRYDLCVNFDLAPEAASLAGRIKADLYKGFGRRPDGSIHAFDSHGAAWLEMSLWDDLKKANRLTYQTHMRRILGAPERNHPILVPLLPELQPQAEEFLDHHGLRGSRPRIGFNVGAGDRWQHKKWTVEGFVQLGEYIYRDLRVRPIILYGPADFERAQEVMGAMTVPFIDAQLRPSMMEFIVILNVCDVVISGDTFALHAALGLGKRVVCLVGPTSASELELYGQGVILQGEIECLGCYLPRCAKDPHCMALLSAERVYAAVKDQVEKLP
ncbi:MAG TPA: glycosyltransferase family 9 protein [bacterium]|nr:glycosyltransferase family 9 protein [Candidatus Omnitrophota bacterium]HOJ58693.1 glycosyltransferase family 9 protein [bacterium]HOL93638.1 glycosyltransferase family 9 protein [bacterium]HPP00109.1 glycosyltransferase family 9 protein [bacterium]